MDEVLPSDADLPGSGWLAVDEGFAGEGGGGVAEAIDCVGDDFPSGDEVVATAATPHYLHPPGRLLHGFGLRTASEGAARRAEQILRSESFAECLGRSVAADLAASPSAAEMLAVDGSPTAQGHRVRFTGGTGAGVRPVNLDVVCVRYRTAVGLLWFADTPDPFPTADIDHVLGRLARRRV